MSRLFHHCLLHQPGQYNRLDSNPDIAQKLCGLNLGSDEVLNLDPAEHASLNRHAQAILILNQRVNASLNLGLRACLNAVGVSH